MQKRSCPLCGLKPESPLNLSTPAIISEFIWRYACIKYWEHAINAVLCGECGVVYFDHCFDQDETELLYIGYRGKRYCAVRQFYESDYLQRDESLQSLDYFHKRVAYLSEFLQFYINSIPGSIFFSHFLSGGQARVLDFGSSDSSILSASIENTLLASCSYRIDSYDVGAEMPNTADYDLIVADQVLQHLSSCSYVLDMVGQARPSTAFVIGVPLELPDVIIKDLIPLCDARDKSDRQNFTVVHEHINYFSIDSLHYICSIIQSRYHREATYFRCQGGDVAYVGIGVVNGRSRLSVD